MKYRELTDKLIKKSFPSLKNFKIFVTEKKIFNFRYSAVTFYFIFFGAIIVHPKARKYPNPALKALLVHELSHLDTIVRKSFLEKIGFAFKWLFTKKEKYNMEREADMSAIRKGYGTGLFKLIKIVEKQKDSLKNRSKHGYLTSKQIKKLINKK